MNDSCENHPSYMRLTGGKLYRQAEHREEGWEERLSWGFSCTTSPCSSSPRLSSSPGDASLSALSCSSSQGCSTSSLQQKGHRGRSWPSPGRSSSQGRRFSW